jgi:uncharacterized membrane protein
MAKVSQPQQNKLSKLPEFEMSKARVEALSDAIIGIIMTLLVIEIKIPEFHSHPSFEELVKELLHLSPLFGAYFLSFGILAGFWLGHHFFYSFYVKNIDRVIIIWNFVFLAFLALIPFSTHLLGTYIDVKGVALVYGANIIIPSLIMGYIYNYSEKAPHIINSDIPQRVKNQGRFRRTINIWCTIIAMGLSFVSVPASLIFIIFPVIYANTPGAVDFTEKLFGFKL